MSLRFRLTIWVLALFVAIKFVTSGVTWLYQRSMVSQLFDMQLQTRAASMAAQIEDRLPFLTADEELQEIADRESRYMQFASFRTLIIGRHGENWTQSKLGWPEDVFETGKQAMQERQAQFGNFRVGWFENEGNPDGSARYVALPIKGSQGQPYALVVAASDEYVRAQSALVAKIFIMSGAFGVLAAGVSGWYVAGLAVAPLKRLKQVARQLRPESIGDQLSTPDRSLEVNQLTQALDEARDRIRKAFETQERFLSNVSHEIKTPIATLLVEAQTIDKSTLSKSAAQFVRTTEEEMRRLGRLVESFLTLTRIRDGKGMAKISHVPANELILDSVANCAPMAKQYFVMIRPILIEDEEHVDATVAGEPELLRTMLDNLVRNAIRFSPQNGVVTIVASVGNGVVSFGVRDEGPGLPPELLSKIFDRFVQAPDEHRRGRGHGLGLAIAQAVAELHGGSIGVSNLPGRGAEFIACIPLSNAASLDTAHVQVATAVAAVREHAANHQT